MFSATQTLDDASGDDVTYVLVSQDANGTKRLDTATNLAAPSYLSIKHSSTGKGNAAVDRHLVQIARTVDSTPEPVTAICNFTLQVPRDSVVTNSMVYDMVANLIDFILNGNLATIASTATLEGLLRGES